MENIRPILYGVSDYAEMRKANAWFVDRTTKSDCVLAEEV